MKRIVNSVSKGGSISLPPLKRICLDANNEHAEVLKATSTAVRHGIRCGELLGKAKALLGHGKFLPWLKENFVGGQRTAQVYMWLAANTQRAADFDSIRAALAATETPVEEVVVAELVKEPADKLEANKRELVFVPGQERPVLLGGRSLPIMTGRIRTDSPKTFDIPNRRQVESHLASACEFARRAGMSGDELLERLRALVLECKLN